MNRILIIAHTPLASALREAALHALPDAANVLIALDVKPTQSQDDIRQAARLLSRDMAAQDGLLVLSDMAGATPCNVAQTLGVTDCHAAQVKCVAGASLPMLLRAITYRHLSLDAMAAKAIEGATNGAVALN